MRDNFLKKYKDEPSESFSSNDEEAPKPRNELLSSSRGEAQGSRSSRRQEEITPYTFDPRRFLESLDNPKPNPSLKPSPPNKHVEKEAGESILGPRQSAKALASRTSREGALGAEPAVPSRPIPNPDVYSVRGAVEHARDPAHCELSSRPEESYGDSRAESEYRGFAREFDGEFGSHQQEVAALSKQLVARIRKLQALERELNSPSTEMSSLRSRLIREVESVEDELGEANHNIIVLMNERKNIKERFCTIRVKHNELKGYTKALQEKMRR